MDEDPLARGAESPGKRFQLLPVMLLQEIFQSLATGNHPERWRALGICPDDIDIGLIKLFGPGLKHAILWFWFACEMVNDRADRALDLGVAQEDQEIPGERQLLDQAGKEQRLMASRKSFARRASWRLRFIARSFSTLPT
jgi:hypothetical protein